MNHEKHKRDETARLSSERSLGIAFARVGAIAAAPCAWYGSPAAPAVSAGGGTPDATHDSSRNQF